MRTLHARLAVLAAVLFVALSASATSPSNLALAGVVVLLSLAVVRVAVGVVTAGEVTVGARARAHREALSEMPEPRHPATAGRPMARAPGMAAAA
jgi:hypothetical protein